MTKPLGSVEGVLTLTIAFWACAVDTPAQEAKRDPYYQPVGAEKTGHMPRVIVRTMTQDRAGHIWFATFGGPIRYDGESFTNFGDTVGLAKSRVFSVFEDKAGALWFGSVLHGASRYDGDSVTLFTATDPQQPPTADRMDDVPGLGDGNISWIHENRAGHVWFATHGGASRYDGETVENFTTRDGLVADQVYAIAEARDGTMWFGTQGGVCSWDGKTFSDLADDVGREFVNIRTMAFDGDGNLWFGGQEGAFRYDGESLTHFNTKNGLLADFVGSMIVDRAGNLWFGHPGGFPSFTGGGATRYDGETFELFDQEDGMSVKTVYCLLEDRDGNIWFGSAGDGVCRWDGETFTDMSAPPPGK